MKIGKVFNVPIMIHWSVLIIFFIFIMPVFINESMINGFIQFFLYCSIYFFVTCHEFGHILMARKFGVNTKSITICAIGGIAYLEKMPEKPFQEFMIAIAGPAASIALGLLFLGICVISKNTLVVSVFHYFSVINFVFTIFNIIPLYPMDGGRILRSLLQMIIKDRMIATKISLWISYIFLLMMAVVASTGVYMLFIITIFLYFAGKSEYGNLIFQKIQR